MNCRTFIFATLFFAFTLSFGACSLSCAGSSHQPSLRQIPCRALHQSPRAMHFPGWSAPGRENCNPDFSPLTGMQNTTLGVPEIQHSYWVPGIQFSSNILSTPSAGGGSSWYVDNYVLGNLSLLEAWDHSTFALNYSGGGYFSSNSSQEVAISSN